MAETDGGDNGAVLREVLKEEQPPSRGPRAAQGEGERLRAKCPFSIFLNRTESVAHAGAKQRAASFLAEGQNSTPIILAPHPRELVHETVQLIHFTDIIPLPPNHTSTNSR